MRVCSATGTDSACNTTFFRFCFTNDVFRSFGQRIGSLSGSVGVSSGRHADEGPHPHGARAAAREAARREGSAPGAPPLARTRSVRPGQSRSQWCKCHPLGHAGRGQQDLVVHLEEQTARKCSRWQGTDRTPRSRRLHSAAHENGRKRHASKRAGRRQLRLGDHELKSSARLAVWPVDDPRAKSVRAGPALPCAGLVLTAAGQPAAVGHTIVATSTTQLPVPLDQRVARRLLAA